MVDSATILINPTKKLSVFKMRREVGFLVDSASLFVYSAMSGSFKGLCNEARPSAVLAACFHTATVAKISK